MIQPIGTLGCAKDVATAQGIAAECVAHAQSYADENGLPPFAQKNVTKTPLVGGQWRMSDDGLFRLAIVDNQTYPDIPLTGDMEAIG